MNAPTDRLIDGSSPPSSTSLTETPITLIDIGANLTNRAFSTDLNQVLNRAEAANVHSIIVTGTSLADSREALALTQRFPDLLYATAGVHPHNAKSFSTAVITSLRELASATAVVAIGECGLDYNRDFSPRDSQRNAFASQVELACELNMPLFLHEREAADDLVAVLDQVSGSLSSPSSLPPICVHCFTGDEATLDRYLERDYYIGITGWICDERRGRHLHQLVERIPANRMMIETDAPYLLPRTIQPRPKSRRNEPSFLPYVVNTIAKACGASPLEIANRTSSTAREFFGLTTNG